MVVKVARIIVSKYSVDSIRDESSCTNLRDRIKLNIFMSKNIVSFHEACDQVVVSIGVLHVKEIWIEWLNGINCCSLHLTFDVDRLPIRDYIFQMIPAELNTKIM